MNILILGGTGAMGVELVKILSKKNNIIDVTSRRDINSTNKNIRYLKGNAHERNFLSTILAIEYDAIIDFMVYSTKEFEERVDLLCGRTKQYVFISSARVYANSELPLSENSPRLLDSCVDENYLKTDEYALTKARQENILMNSKHNNWTIIRPYITYNYKRLQFGWYEKEHWLYRAMQGKTIVVFEDILYKKTTLSYGNDVSKVIANIIGNEKAMSEVFQVTGNESMTWKEILDIYLSVLEKEIGIKPKIKIYPDSRNISKKFNTNYQVSYDRLYNRVFDCSKIQEVCDCANFLTMNEGLEKCLLEFILDYKSFDNIDWIREGYLDRLTAEYSGTRHIVNQKEKIKYLLGFFAPDFVFSLLKYKRTLFK